MLWSVACNAPIDAALTPDDDQPVAEITWESDAPVRAALGYRYRGGPEIRTAAEAEARTSHRFRLAGVRPGEPVEWWLAWEEGGEEVRSRSRRWSVPERGAPGEPPEVEIGRTEDPGYYALTDLDQGVVWITGPDGSPVWWWEIGEGMSINRARLDGDRLWVSVFDPLDESVVGFRSVRLDGSEEEVLALNHHHDFLILPDRMVYLRRVSGLDPDGIRLAGDALVERIDGVETAIWSTFDGADFGRRGDKRYPEGTDWTHCNGIAYDAPRGWYWVSCKNQRAIFVVSRAGELLHTLGEGIGTLEAEGPIFGELHAPIIEGDRLYLFDNDPPEPARARAEVYTLDLAPDLSGGSFALTDTLEDPEANPWVHGDAAPTQTGGLMAAFGMDGRVEVRDADGEIRLLLQTGPLGYVTYLPALSGPVE